MIGERGCCCAGIREAQKSEDDDERKRVYLGKTPVAVGGECPRPAEREITAGGAREAKAPNTQKIARGIGERVLHVSPEVVANARVLKVGEALARPFLGSSIVGNVIGREAPNELGVVECPEAVFKDGIRRWRNGSHVSVAGGDKCDIIDKAHRSNRKSVHEVRDTKPIEGEAGVRVGGG